MGAGPVQIRLPHPKYAIPNFWHNGTIREMGQKRTLRIGKDAQLFSPGYIKAYIGLCGDPQIPELAGPEDCGTFIAGLYKRRDEIVQEHIDGLGFDDRIKNKTNNPCVSDILTKLQQRDMQRLTVPDIGGLAGTGHLSQGILDLFDKSGDYDITFKVEQLGTSNGNEVNGGTRDVPGGWEIKIDSDLVDDGTRLFIAKTIIHESTHAFIQYIIGNKKTSDLVKDLNEIHKTRNDPNLTHHEFISQYIDALAHSLAVWDNNSQSLEYYKKLSWGGLETSDAYKAQTNKDDIQNAIQNERFGRSGAKGTKCK